MLGVILGTRGAVLLAFPQGFLGSKIDYIRLYVGLLFRREPLHNQPSLDRELPVEPWLTEQEKSGWRSIAWGFTLQTSAGVSALVQCIR